MERQSELQLESKLALAKALVSERLLLVTSLASTKDAPLDELMALLKASSVATTERE